MPAAWGKVNGKFHTLKKVMAVNIQHHYRLEVFCIASTKTIQGKKTTQMDHTLGFPTY